MTLQVDSPTELRMTRHTSCFRKISRTSMSYSWVSRVQVMKKIPCSQQKDCNVQHAPKVFKTCLDLGLIMYHGKTSHSRIQGKGWWKQVKGSQRYMPNHMLIAHTTTYLWWEDRVPPTWQQSLILKGHPAQWRIWEEAHQSVPLELQEAAAADQWQPRSGCEF